MTFIYKIRVSAWNGAFGGSADVYVPMGGLTDAAAKLEGFPRRPSDITKLEFGDFGPQSAGGGVSVRFYCTGGAGHAFVEARIESDYDGEEKAQSALLRLSIEATAVDTFVEELRRLETRPTRHCTT